MINRRRNLLGLAVALVLLVNLIILAGVAWNRGSEQTRLSLGERELPLSHSWTGSRENSGLELNLRWRIEPLEEPEVGDYLSEHAYYSATAWLDAARLVELGFELPEPVAGELPRRWRLQSREAWLALEFDGPAHYRSLQRAERWLAAAEKALLADPEVREHHDRVDRAKRHVEQVRNHWSRLLAIDCDADAETLRARHRDPNVVIVRGRIGATWEPQQPAREGKGSWRGHIDDVSVDRIHVPLDLRAPLDTLAEDPPGDVQDRYEAELAWGRRHEPWIIAITLQTR